MTTARRRGSPLGPDYYVPVPGPPGATGAAGPDGNIQVVADYATLRALPSGAHGHVQLRGNGTAVTGMEGMFFYDYVSLQPDDGGTLIKPDDVSDLAPGRWKRHGVDGVYDAHWFGLDETGNGLANHNALKACLASASGQVTYVRPGTFRVRNWLGGDSANQPMVGVRSALIGCGPLLTIFLLDEDLSHITPPEAGEKAGTRWLMTDSYSYLAGFTIDGNKDAVDRVTYRGILSQGIRTVTDSVGVVWQDITVRNMYVEPRRWTVTDIDSVADGITAPGHLFGEGDSVRLTGGFGTATVSIAGEATEDLNGKTGRIANIDGDIIFIEDFDIITEGSLTAFSSIEDISDFNLEGFAFAAVQTSNFTMRRCIAEDNDGSGIANGGRNDVHATKTGKVGTFSVTTNRISSVAGSLGVSDHGLDPGMAVTFEGVTDALVSIDGAAAVSPNGLTGIVDQVFGTSSWTMVDWVVTANGTDGYFQSDDIVTYGNHRYIDCESRRNAWQNYAWWKVKGLYTENCISEDAVRQGFNIEFCEDAIYHGGSSTGCLNDIVITGWNRNIRFDDVYLDGAVQSEIMVRSAGGRDLWFGPPKNIMLRNLRFGPNIHRHLSIRTSSFVTVNPYIDFSPAAPHLLIDCPGAEDWNTWGTYLYRGTAESPADLVTYSLQDSGLPAIIEYLHTQRSGAIDIFPLPAFKVNTAANASVERYVGAGTTSLWATTFTSTGADDKVWRFKLPKLRKVLVSGRYKLVGQNAETFHATIRVRRSTGASQANLKYIDIRANSVDNDQWIPFQFVTSCAIPDEDHELQIVVYGGTGTRSIIIDGLNAYRLDSDGVTIADDDEGRQWHIVEDEFSSGPNTSPGSLSWTVSAIVGTTPTATQVTGTTSTEDHPSVHSLNAFQTVDSAVLMRLSNAVQYFDIDSYFSTWFYYREAAAGYTTPSVSRIGLSADAQTRTPTEGLYAERSGASANWKIVCRNGGAETSVDSGVPAGAINVRLRLRRLSPTQLGARITNDSGATFSVIFSSVNGVAGTTYVPAGLPANNPQPFFVMDNGGNFGGATPTYGLRIDRFKAKIPAWR